MEHPEYLPSLLLLVPDQQEASRICEEIDVAGVHREIQSTQSLPQAEESLQRQDFDIVIADSSLLASDSLHFLHQLRLREHAPSVVLLISDQDDPRRVMDMHNAGAERIVLKEGEWCSSLGVMVRQLLRIQRLEQENQTMLARLIEANQLLEEKNRRLDEFSATVAHDIRGPLGGISMKLEYILDAYEDEIEGRLKDILTRALVSSQRLTDIVQAMYDFAKLGAKAARMIEVDLRSLVPEVITDLALPESEDISFHLGDLPKVWGNPELLRRLFSNLISNAVKYNDKSEKEIYISCRGKVAGTLAMFCDIEVSDNGIGIDPLDLKEVFSIFRRGNKAPNTAEGLGVGLAVVQRIVELHYGKVQVHSALGEGTTFDFTLPLERIILTPSAQEA